MPFFSSLKLQTRLKGEAEQVICFLEWENLGDDAFEVGVR